MVRRIRLDRGDIVSVRMNPTPGQEIQGEKRPCLILTIAAYNAGGLALVAPITQGGNSSRFAGFAVPMMGTGTETQGVVLCNQVRTIDLAARGARRIERASPELVDEVLAKVTALLE